ncbi:MAG: hypothetical protein EPO26_03800 [Chloroflexota bacterium]|nr:MAG: hypothetical protein EPO26_03800 [Chloroflexota bacterium]
MAMISERDREYIRQHFAEKLTDDVTLELYTRPKPRLHVPGREACLYCAETRQLVEEVADLSDRVNVVVHDVLEEPNALADAGISEIPALVFKGKNKGTVRYFGIPAGNEFRNLIDNIVGVASGESGLSLETEAALATLAKDVHLRVFVTPT